MEKKHRLTQKYSVLITDQENTSSGSGLLYYPGKDKLYIFTCRHVIEAIKSDTLKICMLIPIGKDDCFEEKSINVLKTSVMFPDDDCIDLAIIQIEKDDNLSLEQSAYYIDNAIEDESVYIQGYPGLRSKDEILEYALDFTLCSVLKCKKDHHSFVLRNEERGIDQGNRVYELEGFSGSPVWKIEGENLCVSGLLSKGLGKTVYRSKLFAVNVDIIVKLMSNYFNINMMRLSDNNDVKATIDLWDKENSQKNELSQKKQEDHILITVVIKKGFNGITKIVNGRAIVSKILIWISNNKNAIVNVNVEMKELDYLHNRYAMICDKIDKEKIVSRREKKLFMLYPYQKELLFDRNKTDILACELFFKYKTNQEFFNLDDTDDYVYILSQIITNDFRDYNSFLRSNDCEIIDCICYLSEDEEFSFSVPIKKESIPVGIINDCLLGYDLRIRDLSLNDKKNRRLLLVRYYKAIAHEIIMRKPNLLNYNKVKDLENYYIGVH